VRWGRMTLLPETARGVRRSPFTVRRSAFGGGLGFNVWRSATEDHELTVSANGY